MTELRTAIYNTVLYCDVFDYAPTLLDIRQWLIDYPDCVQVAQIAAEIEQDERLHYNDGVCYLATKTGLPAERRKRYTYSYQKYRHAKPFLRLLAAMPGVRLVALSNSVAWNNAGPEADTDLFIVAAPGKLWTARFFTTLTLKLLRQRPGEQDHAKAVCAPFFVDRDHLQLRHLALHQNDLYFTFWVNQLVPLYDDATWDDFVAANHWITQDILHSRPVHTMPRRRIELTAIEHAIKRTVELLPLERLLKKIQRRILPATLQAKAAEHGNSVVINGTTLKFHTTDRRRLILTRWEHRRVAS